MFDQNVTILENRSVNSEYYKLVFASKELCKGVKPGQFMNIRIENGSDPLWRRPFSYYRSSKNRVEILYEIFGKGTELLARKKKGETLRVLGPLGKPFTQNVGKRHRILVGGGVGVPPLMFLAERLNKKDEKASLLIGCRDCSKLLPKNELRKVHADVLYATDDGSYGMKGLVTDLLERVLQKLDPKKVFIQTCGPKPMMFAVMRVAKKYGISGEMSIDERMACGIGACLGCVVETNDGWKPSCTEGPVFSFDELV